ncbi:hypothetical protein SDC9_139276 [bioreactor metagenome]|uniref:Uncharacterized protein n=1 Tax=bioreactor metagenome TaxID=1076179 RepID=A0A645DS55_9ZZZZ
MAHQVRAQLIYLFTGEAINNARLVFELFYKTQGLLQGIFLFLYFNKEVFAVKAGHKFVGVIKPQRTADIPAHPWGGCGRQSQADRLRVAAAYFRHLAVLWPEIMAPFRDTMGFINDQQGNLDRIQQTKEPGSHQRFWRYIEQFCPALADRGHILAVFFGVQGAIQKKCRNSGCAHLLYLVFHKGDQR